VRFLGEVRGQAKRDLLAAADALVLPSRVDGAPTVLAEAAAAGLPVLKLEELRTPPARKAPDLSCDWSVIGPRLAAALPLWGNPGRVYVKRM